MPSTTRDRLVAAAWTILRDEGLSAATSRRITERAEANLAAITYHFGSKDVLLGEAIVEQLRSWTAPLNAALTADTNDIDEHDAQVATAVAEILARFASRPQEIQPVINLLLTNPAIPGVGDAVVTWLGELRAVATDLMTRQQAAGKIPETVNPPVMAGVFTAFALGLAALDTAAGVGEFLALLVRPTAGQ